MSKDRTLALWDTISGKRLRGATFAGFGQAVAFSHDGRLIAAGDWAGSLRILDANSLETVLEVEHRRIRPVNSILAPVVGWNGQPRLFQGANHGTRSGSGARVA